MKSTFKQTLIALCLALGGFAALGQENRSESDGPKRGPAERARAEEVDSISKREDAADRPAPRRLRERGTPAPRGEEARRPRPEDRQGAYAAQPARRRGPGGREEMGPPRHRGARDGAGVRVRPMDRESARFDDGDRGERRGPRGPRGPMAYRQTDRPVHRGDRMNRALERCPECGAVLRHGPPMSFRSERGPDRDRDREVAPAPHRRESARGGEDDESAPRRGPGPREPRG